MSDLLSQKSSANFNTRADAPQSIPPHLLVSFLGVAQHRSMSHAATVQCIPHGQMTQHMTRLETMIGAPLFQGQSGKLVLTSLGERLYSGIKDPMESLQIGASHLVGGQVDATPRLAAPRLRISLQIWGLAALLQPYLMDLQGLGADLNFVSAKQAKTEPPDVLCYLGRAPMDGYACEPLVGEEIISVCSDRYPLPKGGFSGVGLRTEPLLSLAHPDHLQDWHGFLGMDPDSSLPGIDKAPYQSFSTYLKALRSGRGIGVGLAPLFAADISAGQLKLASQRRVWRNRSIFLAVDENSAHPNHAKEFAEVLKQAFRNVGQMN